MHTGICGHSLISYTTHNVGWDDYSQWQYPKAGDIRMMHSNKQVPIGKNGQEDHCQYFLFDPKREGDSIFEKEPEFVFP